MNDLDGDSARPSTESGGSSSAIDPARSARRGLVALRLGIGVVWALNLIFILDPQNAFFPTFSSTAASFATQSLGGQGFPSFVATHPDVFSFLIAGVTLYLAAAFLLGVTTRAACVVGAGFALCLLVSQWGSTFVIPGGTDVGPMPLYLAAYFALFVGHAERLFSVDAALSERPQGWRTWLVSHRAGPG
jgi:uncharacterized membrane protein YphA (DoxX/SURF4 family)